jgi:hypothetical protein
LESAFEKTVEIDRKQKSNVGTYCIPVKRKSGEVSHRQSAALSRSTTPTSDVSLSDIGNNRSITTRANNNTCGQWAADNHTRYIFTANYTAGSVYGEINQNKSNDEKASRK